MTQVKTLTRKLTSFTLSAAVALGAAAGAVINAPAAAVYADEEQTEPNPIQESYEIDGVTYYNSHSTNFNSDKVLGHWSGYAAKTDTLVWWYDEELRRKIQ